ncbi:MAG TPA: EamA family transporter [Thermoleophilaceae bacterium]|nr:EamA family transporter [Thermoleophilaceae bacterium]
MPFAAFALALSSAFVHALWNLLLARARDSEAATAVALIVGTIVFAPVAALTWDIDSGVWPYLAASAALELAYFALLAAAYDRGELSVVYPIARGSAPVLVAIFSVLFLGIALHALTVTGVLLVAGGVLLVRGVTPLQAGDSTAFALAIGTTIASYTLFDKAGLHHAEPLTYLELVILPSAVVYPLWISRRKSLRAELSGSTIVAGIAMFGAFGLALAAIRLAPQAFVPGVQALRETSVVIAVAAGALFLGERVSRMRVIGAVVVVAGIVALALA